MSTILERLASLPSATVSDVQRTLQPTYCMDPAIHCLTPGIRLAGQAFTVLARGSSIISVHKALLEAPAGSVLVVGGETPAPLNGALFGKLMATQAKLRGIVGLIADGVVRDIADLRQLRFPVFARGTTPYVGTNRVVGRTQVPIPCGGLLVSPGDYMLGDDDGIVVVPASLAETIVSQAEARVKKEEEYLRRMEAGEHIADLIGFRQLIEAEKQ